MFFLRPMGWGEERQKTERQAFVHALWVLAPCPDLKAPWSPKHGKIHTYPLSDGENRACKRPCARLYVDKLKVPAGCIELLKQLTLRPCACYRKHQKCLRHDHTLIKLKLVGPEHSSVGYSSNFSDDGLTLTKLRYPTIFKQVDCF